MIKEEALQLLKFMQSMLCSLWLWTWTYL